MDIPLESTFNPILIPIDTAPNLSKKHILNSNTITQFPILKPSPRDLHQHKFAQNIKTIKLYGDDNLIIERHVTASKLHMLITLALISH
eukprot:7897839-Ditylum_brightwellii.AAC.2